jgi:hypothetical protein
MSRLRLILTKYSAPFDFKPSVMNQEPATVYKSALKQNTWIFAYMLSFEEKYFENMLRIEI